MPQLLLEADSGTCEAGLETVRAILYSSRPPADSNSLVGMILAGVFRQYAAGGVERVLAQGEPSPEALDACTGLLEQEMDRPLLLNAFRGSRAGIEDDIRAMDDGLVTRAKLAEMKLFSDYHVLVHWPPADRFLNHIIGSDFRLANGTAVVRHMTWVIECLKDSPDGLQLRAAEWAALRSAAERGSRRHRHLCALRIRFDPGRSTLALCRCCPCC